MKNTEFLIIGNGLAGTLLGFEMLMHGIDFRIVTSSQKSRASEAAAGMFNPLVFKRLTKSWMADELLPVMKHKYKHIETLLGTQFYFEKDILKPLSFQERLLWEERRVKQDFSKYIYDVVDKSPVDQLMPADGFGLVKGSGYLSLSAFLNAADSYFDEKGLLIRSTINIHQINAEPKTQHFQIDDVHASKIIFCEGAHLTLNPFFKFIKLVPVKGEVLLIHSDEISEDYILNKKVFLLPVGNRLFKTGSTYEWKDLSETPTQSARDSINERLDKLVKAHYSIKEHLAGIRPTISDRRPVLGVHPEYENLYVFNGLGTKGVMLAPYFAVEMLKLLTIKSYSVKSEVDIERFLVAN